MPVAKPIIKLRIKLSTKRQINSDFIDRARFWKRFSWIKMAKLQGKVYLGFEEEIVGDKNQTLVNYTVNKIGGFPVS